MVFYRVLLVACLAFQGDAQQQTLTTVKTQSPTTQFPTSAPSPSPTTPPLLPPATTDNSLFQCWTYWNNATNEYISADRNRTITVIPYTTRLEYSLSWDSSAEFTTLCDGKLRAVKPPVKNQRLTSTITDFSASQTYWLMPPLSYSDVDCGFCDYCADCESIAQFVEYSSSLWSQQPEPRTPATLSLQVPCRTGTPRPPRSTSSISFPTALHSPSCLVVPEHDEATFFYWPVTTVSGDFCLQNGKTITATPTLSGTPNTAVYNNITITSPTAVLVIPTLTALVESRYRTNKWKAYGTHHTSATYFLHPSAVSSVNHEGGRRQAGTTLTSHVFNYADLNTVPYEKYTSAKCPYNNGDLQCERIGDIFRPKIGIEKDGMGRWREEWKFCEGWGSVLPYPVPVTAGVTTTTSI